MFFRLAHRFNDTQRSVRRQGLLYESTILEISDSKHKSFSLLELWCVFSAFGLETTELLRNACAWARVHFNWTWIWFDLIWFHKWKIFVSDFQPASVQNRIQLCSWFMLCYGFLCAVSFCGFFRAILSDIMWLLIALSIFFYLFEN